MKDFQPRFMHFLLTVALLFFAMRFLHFSQAYPFYFIADMDLTTTVDTLLIQSGMLPVHIIHPGFGMYLFLKFSNLFSEWIGSLSFLRLEDFTFSLNPFLGIEELTTVIRAHSPWLALGVLLALWGAVSNLFRQLPRMFLVLIFMTLGTQQSLLYHASMVRTELYSFFYWSVSVLFLSLATTGQKRGLSILLLLAAGLGLGLSFFTKIQSFFYLMAFPVLLVLFYGLRSHPLGANRVSPLLSRRSQLILSGANFGMFVTLLILSYGTSIPAGFETATQQFGVTPISLLFMSAFCVLFLIQGLKRFEAFSGLMECASLLNLVASGFLIALLLHLVMFQTLSSGWWYLMYDLKVVFFRSTYYEVKAGPVYFQPQYNKAIGNFIEFGRIHPVLFLSHFATLGLLAHGFKRRWLKISQTQLICIFALSAIAVINLILGVRFILRDLLWVEGLFNFLTVLGSAIVLLQLPALKLRYFWATIGVVFALMVANFHQSTILPHRLDAYWNSEGWKKFRWFRSVYAGNQNEYQALMERRLSPEARNTAFDLSGNLNLIRRTMSFVFQNVAVPSTRLGIAAPGFPVSAAAPDVLISQVSPDLKGGIVVDALGLERGKKYFYHPEMMAAASEYLNRLVRPGSPEELSLLNRSDLDVFLLIQPSDLELFRGRRGTEITALEIEVSSTRDPTRYHAVRIIEAVAVPVQQLNRQWFAVVRPKAYRSL